VTGSTDVVVVGAGQAGLATSWHLAGRGIDHVVLERDTVGHDWQDRRWDSFCLVTPNWQCDLPGFAYSSEFGGSDPDGFMLRDEISAYLAAYRASFDPPVRERVAVSGVRRDDGRLVVTTSDGELSATAVVVATGGYHHPVVPRLGADLPDGLLQLHSSTYRNSESLPAGDVLVVGTGQSGAQIAEDLHRAGRQVHLAVGSAPRVARFYRGRDVVAWLDDMGYYSMSVDDHPMGRDVRQNTNHYVTGRDGGHDIDLRQFAVEGMALYGHLLEVSGSTLRFGDDLAANLDRADAVSESIKDSIDTHLADHGIDAPTEARYRPLWRPSASTPRELALDRLGAVVWATGYRRDYGWLGLPVIDERGYPRHERGLTDDPAVSFVGLPWQWTWGSGRFSGVGADAAHVVDHVARHLSATAAGVVTG
jgi:putative flavoprotein involved in K+ transport